MLLPFVSRRVARLADDVGVDTPLLEDDGTHFFLLFRREKEGTAQGEFGFDGVVGGINDDDRLLGGADDAVIEGF